MKEFEYVIKEAVGIHARPASLLAKEASGYKSSITLFKNEEKGDAKKLLSIMSLGIKCSETVRFVIEGEDEEAAACKLEAFCRQNL
ncbi:HPr family phosphocarrier protein [Lacrimispora brassicae]